MKNSVRENPLIIKIMSLVIACALWVYVMNEQNPFTTRSFSVPLNSVNLAEDMVVKDLPNNVKIRVSGPRAQVSALSEERLQAFVDLSEAAKGRNTYAVQARSPVGEIVEISPSLLQLELDTLAEKTVTIEPRIVGVPNSGVTVGKMDLKPTSVTIRGASGRIAEVDKVIVLVDISDREKNFEDDAAVVALGKDGREMYDVKITPDKVHISVVVLKQLATNNFPIKANLSGSLPAGFEVESIKLSPETVKLTAEPSVLGNLTEIKTAPVVLDKITGDVELKTPLQLPDNILADTHNVIVDIKLKKVE